MSLAAERLIALVSGLSPKARESRLMILLQPHADDSGSDPQSHTFVFGGLVAAPSEWLAFTHEWQAALDSGPAKLEYFKMTEAMSFSGQFARRRGWTVANRDAKLADLVEIVMRNARYGAWVSMRQADYRKYLQSIPLPVRNTTTDTPYLFLITQFILMLCEHAKRNNADCSFDFIFDEQIGIDKVAILWWPHLKALAAENGIERYLGSPPMFRDEKCILPLQAADLFVWEHRMHQTKNKVLVMPPSKLLKRLDELLTINVRFSETALASMNSVLVGMSAQYAKENPDKQT